MKTKHDGDCSFYTAIADGVPEAGICTCGCAHQLKFGGDCFVFDEMYSKELEKHGNTNNPRRYLP